MKSFLVTVRVTLEVEAVDQETAIEMAEAAARRTRFAVGHKMMSVKNQMPTTAEEQHEPTQPGR